MPGEEHKLWVVPLKAGEKPPTANELGGKPGKYKVQLLLSRPGYPFKGEREHKFVDEAIGNSHVVVAKPRKDRTLQDADQVILEANNGSTLIRFIGLPNDDGYLGKLVVEEIMADNLDDAEKRAYEAVSPFLSAWSLHLDVPVHIETIQVTDLQRHISSLRVTTPHFEMTFAGGITPPLSDDFSQYASLYREGMNSNSACYRFLCFYKIIESIAHRRGRIAKEAKEMGKSIRRFAEELPDDQSGLLALLEDILTCPLFLVQS